MATLTTAYYTLMNRDMPMLEFSCQRNAFDEPEFSELQWHTAKRPIGYRSLTSFLEKRQAPKQRKHIQQIIEMYGCEDLEGFIKNTHALSLSDTFWIRKADETLSWQDVSLYIHEFNKTIAYAAFDGAISDADLSLGSPEFCTDGRYAKCWVREEGGVYLCKSGSTHYEIEPLAEYLVTQLASELCPSAVTYDMAYYRGKLICKCPLFTSEEVGFAKAGAILRGSEHTIPELLRFFTKIGSEDAFRRMCVLDAVILNTDRHYGNFGVLFDTATMDVLGMAPVFDHNRSLLPELNDEQLADSQKYLPLYHPRIGSDFILTAKGLLTDSIRNDLERLRSFEFQPHPTVHDGQNRINALSKIVQGQIQKILE